MSKFSSAFRMSKSSKVYLINNWQKPNQRQLRKAWVDAEVSAANANQRRIKDKPPITGTPE